jgi:lipoate-protein ligase A
MMHLIKSDKYKELFGGTFELLDHGKRNGKFNMDYDYQRAMEVQTDTKPPMLRLYAWQPWAVSLGMNQKKDDVNEEICREKGFDIVRRPTGGRAVLHAHELTYCVVLKIPQGWSVHDCYREIHTFLVDGLRHLGCDKLEFEKSQPDLKSFYENQTLSVSCFASSARYEIEYKRRKLVGSAQHNYNGVLLQHGSILIGEGHEQLSDVANLKSDKEHQILKRYILKHSSTIEEILGKKVEYQEVADAIKSVFINYRVETNE